MNVLLVRIRVDRPDVRNVGGIQSICQGNDSVMALPLVEARRGDQVQHLAGLVRNEGVIGQFHIFPCQFVQGIANRLGHSDVLLDLVRGRQLDPHCLVVTVGDLVVFLRLNSRQRFKVEIEERPVALDLLALVLLAPDVLPQLIQHQRVARDVVVRYVVVGTVLPRKVVEEGLNAADGVDMAKEEDVFHIRPLICKSYRLPSRGKL